MFSKISIVVALVLAMIGLVTCFAATPAAWGQGPWQMLYTFSGEGEGYYLGFSVSGAGDVDSDGYDDLIAGAPLSGAGRAYVYSGQTGAVLWTFTGEAADDWFGTSVSGAGDVNNDGYADLIVGAIRNDAGGTDAGRAYVFSGLDGDTLYIFTGEAAEDYFGFSVSGAGDVNNDGYADLIVGARQNDAGGTDAGRAYVYSGLDGDTLYIFAGEAAGDWLGFSVSGAGDVNNDGYDDLIVGAPYNNAGGTQAGRAYVYSGQTGALLWTFTGEADEELGCSVSGAGDVDNDGYEDLIAGAYSNSATGSQVGRAYVYSGQTGAVLWTFTGEAAVDVLGCSVSGAGDVNNDGYDDLIVGAMGSDAGGNEAGRAYVFSGLDGDTLHVLTGEAAYDQLGYSVSGAGDVNSDGNDDLIVGAPFSSGELAAAGKVFVYTCTYSIKIESISDVGNDQGRQAHIDWSSFPGGDPLLTDFSIFRRRDSLLISVPDKPVIGAGLPLTYPPGQWEWLATIPAFGETLYSAVVPTLKDSTIAEGMYWSVFFVRAGTDNPTVYFDSPVDSGYSLDNLSPSPPAGLIASHEPAITVLTWTGSDDADFDYYAIYRDTLSGFDPDTDNRLGYTIDTTFTDSIAPLGKNFYYVVSATDFSGNESAPSDEAAGVRFIAGDANVDGQIAVEDVVFLISYLFRNGPAPVPFFAGDATCDGDVTVDDVVFLISYLFRGGPSPEC